MDEMQNSLESQTEYDIPKERQGFVTFYLWLLLVINSLMDLGYFVSLFTSKGMWTAYDPMWTRIYGFVASAVMVYGLISILFYWKRLGFVIVVALAVVNLAVNVFTGPVSVATFSPLLGILILFAVLQIRKNGISCWDMLDGVGD